MAKEDRVTRIMNDMKISEYEKIIRDINFEHKTFETQWSIFSSGESTLLSSIEATYFDKAKALRSSIYMLELSGVNCDDLKKLLRQITNLSVFEQDISKKLGSDSANLSFEEKLELHASKIETDEDYLDAKSLYDLFALCTGYKKEYNAMANKVSAKVNAYKKTMSTDRATLRALREAGFTLDIEEMIGIVRDAHISIDRKYDNISNSLNDDVKLAEFFNKEASVLRYEYISNIKKYLLPKSSEFLKPVQKFNEYINVKYPNLASLSFEDKIKGLIEIYKEGKVVPEDDAVALLVFSSFTSSKYKSVFSELSGYVNVYKEDSAKIIEAIKAKKIKIDAFEMIRSIKRYNDFFNSSFKASDLSYFDELKDLGVVKFEDYSDYSDELLNSLLPRAFALVKLAIEKKKNITPYDVQLMGALALNEGNVAQMYTGEGKTLTALFSAFLNSLTGEEVDVFTPNDYLAERDAEGARSILGLLGLSVGCTLASDQDVKQKKLAYKSNVVYGSSSAFAFDLLKDTYAAKEEDTVQRSRVPYYAIIDEADRTLIDEALVPFKLENGKRVTKRDEDENKEIIEYLTTAYDYSVRLLEKSYSNPDATEISDDFLRRAMGEDLTVRFGLRFGTEDELEEYNRIQENNYVIMGKSDAALTYLGNIALFGWYMHDQIKELDRQAAVYFKASKDYVEGVHYTITDGELSLTPEGLLKAVDYIKEYNELEKIWLSDPKCNTIRSYVNTQLRAFAMEKGANDNGYDVIFNPETGREEIVILEAGRIQKFSKYERGLHQALELKEFGEIRLDQVSKLMDSSFDTITMNLLLYRYNKISGMTGTSDKDLFRNVYMMDTVSIPRNAEYQYRIGTSTKKPKKVVEHPCVLYRDEDKKIDAIANDIFKSWLFGQPVLMITDNNDEARKIFDVLSDKYGLDDYMNLLISGNEEEEARMVSEAGRIGSITIASEMAGRGTDIRLMVDEEDARDLAERISEFDLIVKLAYEKYKIDKPNVSLERFRNIVFEDFSILEDYVSDSEIETAFEDPEIKRSFDTAVEILIPKVISAHQTKGLKFIQTKPFKTMRNDDQARGRVGRQGEAGETIMYACLNDLNDIGVDDEDKEFLSILLDDGDYVEDSEIDGAISEVIERAQSNIELSEDRTIASLSGVDFSIYAISNKFLDSRKKILKTKDVSYTFDAMINSALGTIIKDNLPKHKKKKFDRDKKIRLKKLDLDSFLKQVHDVFGFNIAEATLRRECRTVSEARDFVKRAINERVDTLKGQNFEMFNSNIRSTIFEGLNKTYDSFMYSVESVREQEFGDMLAQNNKHNRINEVTEIYSEALKDFRFSTLKQIFRPNIKSKKGNSVEEDRPIVIEDSDETFSSITELNRTATRKR